MNPNIEHTMTRYEKAKILGVRMEQLARGSKPCVDIDEVKAIYGDVSVRTIALLELDKKTMPLKIYRRSGSEYYKLEDLITQ